MEMLLKRRLMVKATCIEDLTDDKFIKLAKPCA